MRLEIETEAERNLQKLEREGRLEGRKVILFGLSDYSEILYRMLENCGRKVFAVIDNNLARHNTKMEKARVYHTSRFFEKYDDDYIFLIMSGYYDEMKIQLEEQGYIEKIHIFKVAEVDRSDLWHAFNDTRLEMHLSDVIEGRKLYKKLVAEYGENIRIILRATHSMGDVYLMSFYIKEYLKLYDNCLFIFGNETVAELAKALGFGKVLCLPREHVWALVNFAKVCGLNKLNVEITSMVHFRIFQEMLIYNGKTDLAKYYRDLFELPGYTKADIQMIQPQENVDNYFEKYGLKKGKTVILAPNARALPLLEDKFWKLLADRLIQGGYSVCTNVGAVDGEAVQGTVPVFVHIKDMQQFAEKAGIFISLRSGLCDVVGNVNCKKMILYNFGFYSAESAKKLKELYDMKKMGFGGELYEYVIGRENETEILETILHKLI